MKNTKDIKKLDRRSFLQVSALAGGGLMIGFYAPSALAQRGGPGGGAPALSVSNFITINPDNTFTIIAKNPETGQGIRNALPMIIADELDVDWSQVKVQQADRDQAKYGQQIEGGSTAIPSNYTPMRTLGATARAMVLAAAADNWKVPVSELTTSKGVVTHAASRRTATYASLAAHAATLPVPTNVALKDPKDFKVIGQPLKGIDVPAIITGKPSFSIDVNPPGMLYAVFEKCPVFGGKVMSANIDDIKKLPGVKHAFVVDAPAPPAGGAGARGGGPGGAPITWSSGVAIVADNWWLAQNARKSLKVVWDEGAVAAQSSTGYATQAKTESAKADQIPAGGGAGGANIGDTDAAFKSAAKIVEREYYFPLLSHAPLEPMNSTAIYKDGKLEVWSPSQIPNLGNPGAGAGVPDANVTMHLVRAGGGFGRRLYSEYDIEVGKIARMVADERVAAGQPSVPVKLLWTREDDIAHDDYRPFGFHFFKAALDGSGKLIAFRDQSMRADNNSVIPAGEFPRGFVPNFRVSAGTIAPYGVPTGAMRAPSTNGISFVMQSFIDELAYEAGKDPLQYRLDLLNSPVTEAPQPGARGGGGGGFNAERAKGVLEAVRQMSKWDTARAKLPKGTGMGVAFQFAHAGYVAYVVEAAVDANKKIRINNVWCAVDIGSQIINPSEADNLVHGGFVEGMSHAMAWEITIDKGRVVQKNFPDYPPTRMSQVPKNIEVKFLKTNYNPTGLGEPSLPPAVPAITNAIFHATGTRIRTLPLKAQGYSWT